MKITLTDSELESLTRCFEASRASIQVANLLNQYLDEHYRSITKEAIVEQRKHSASEEEAFVSLLYEKIGIEKNSEYVSPLSQYTGFPIVRRLDPDEYRKDPYYQNIRLPEKHQGTWILSNNCYEPFEGFVTDETVADHEHHFGEITPIGYFPTSFSYPVVMEKNVVWMSVTPHEINTMKEPIQKAHGKVVTFGLGLGYYAYMVSQKENVESVTVIEKDGKAITLFKKYILPQFEHPEKIHIVQNDAYRYAEKQMSQLSYDYAFVDLYHNVIDALPYYHRFRILARNIPQTKFDYWIEKTILCYFRRYLLLLMEESLQGYEEKDYLNPKFYEGHILLSLYQATASMTINTLEEAYRLLSDESLQSLINKLQ